LPYHDKLERLPLPISPNLVLIFVGKAGSVFKILAYCDTATITAVKGFMVLAPEPNVIKLSKSIFYK
jgi:hypothetical protein